MKPPTARSAFALAALSLGPAACEQESPDRLSTCAEARSFALTAHARSRVVGTRVVAGAKVACETRPADYRTAVAALARTPDSLRPARLVLHLAPELEPGAPPLRGVEMHAESGELLVGPELCNGELAADSVTLWLHELAHVKARGARPVAPVAGRLIRAVEEGVADYFAAAIAASPRVGVNGVELRDLEAPPVLRDSEWAALALPRAFDPHRFGWVLAAKLFQSEPQAGALLEDALRALARPEAWPEGTTTPKRALAELLRRCPERSRTAFERGLLRWLPPELYQG